MRARIPLPTVSSERRVARLRWGTSLLLPLLASACASAPPVAPTVHVISERPRDTFVCRAEAMRRGHRGMGPHGMGPHGRGPHDMGPHGTAPPGAPPPWAAAPVAPAAPATPSARARTPREPAAPTAPALEVALARADAPASGWETELRLHASGAPLGAVLVEIGRVAHVGVFVAPDVAQRPVVAHADALAASVLIDQLVESTDARIARRDAFVLVRSRQAFERRAAERRRASIEVPAVETRGFTLGDGARARELAQVYCHLHAGPRGAAATLGDDLVVTDTRSHLDQLEALVTSMHGAAATPPPSP